MKRLICIGAIVLLFATSAESATINVPAGGNINQALANAQPGDEVVLVAGATYTGPITLPVKSGTGVITLRSSGALPNRRITPADIGLLASISAVGIPVITVNGPAGNYKLDGLKLTSTHLEVLVIEGASNIVLDRLYIPGNGTAQKRGVRGNGKNITLMRSHIDNVWSPGQDSQAFAAWDGSGPYKIIDNFLEAASENVIFGGTDPSSEANIPSDILVENNFMTKNLAWKGVSGKAVKNIFELKNAKRVVIRNNIFENNWVDGQAGTAIVITPRNQNNTAPYTVISDVLFENNIVRNTPHIFSIWGYDNAGPSQQTTNIVIRNNLLIGSGGGRFAMVANEVGNLTFDRNTYVQPTAGVDAVMLGVYHEGNIALPTGSRPAMFAAVNLVVTNNLFQANTYGVHSSGAAQGTASLTAETKSFTWTNNVMGGGQGTYPQPTFFPTKDSYAALFDTDYKLKPGSPYTNIGWSGETVVVTPPVDPIKPPDNPVLPGTGLLLDSLITSASCKITATAQPPDATGGWRAQFKLNGNNMSTSDSTTPYSKTVNVPSGTYQLTVTWTKTGQTAKTSLPIPITCQ